MVIEEILDCYKAMSADYHAEPDRKKALEVYNTAYENLLESSGMERENFGYLLAHGELRPASPQEE